MSTPTTETFLVTIMPCHICGELSRVLGTFDTSEEACDEAEEHNSTLDMDCTALAWISVRVDPIDR